MTRIIRDFIVVAICVALLVGFLLYSARGLDLTPSPSSQIYSETTPTPAVTRGEVRGK